MYKSSQHLCEQRSVPLLNTELTSVQVSLKRFCRTSLWRQPLPSSLEHCQHQLITLTSPQSHSHHLI